MANNRNHGGKRSGDTETHLRSVTVLKPLHLTAREEDVALSALANGLPDTHVAQVISRSHESIRELRDRCIDATGGLDVARYREERLQRAVDATRERRLKVGNLLLDRTAEMLTQENLDGTDLRNAAVAFGVATDKRRLEEGQSTENLAVQVRVFRRKR